MGGEKSMTLVPRAFFITSGVGMDSEQTTAFDLALCDAGIGENNLVEVSSIIPMKAVETERSDVTFTAGEITFCVISRADGWSGEVIGAGIGYSWLTDVDAGDESQNIFGIIGEHHGHYPSEYLEVKIREKLYKMAEARNKKIVGTRIKAKAVAVEVEEGRFGSVVVILVFVL
jgi:arginine decarboxylase